MPKKKRIKICLPKKGLYKKKISEENGPEKELTISIKEHQTSECVGTQANIPGIDQGIQTEKLIKSDHDYCANWDASTSCITNEEVSSYCDVLNTGFIDCSDNDVMNDAFVQDPNVIEYGEIESSSFQIVVQEVVDQLNRHVFSTFATADKLSINKLYVHAFSAVEFSIELKSDFTCNVIVHRKPLSKGHEIWNNLPTLFDRSSSIMELCEKARKYNVCCGNYEEEFTRLVDIGVGLSNNQQPDIVAYREGDFGAKQFSSTIRTVKCDLLSSTARCSYCRLYRKALQKRKYRKEANLETKRLFSHTNYRHKDMSRENLIQKLTEQKSEIKSLHNELWKVKREFQNSIRMEGVKVKESENMELKELMNCCNSDFEKSFPDGNSRQRLFWEQQQLHASKSNNRGMRWHPMIIRWCLFIRQKSAKAFDAIRDSGFINLPSTRTLFDYSHYIKGKIGFQPEVFKLAKEEATKKNLFDAEWRQYVGLLFDEIKIKEDLVYDKHSGELIGYCNLGDIGNQMLEFEQIEQGTQNSVAKYVMVVMLRSLSLSWCFPLAAFATSSITADFIYPIIWKTVSLVERQVKLKVLFWTCDGASPNRRFFSLHYAGNDVVYKTKNLYDRSRNIYFISDVPHLLKTLRNNFSNSYSHKTSRRLWRNGKDISWLHIVKLFEEQCEGNLYNPCPKLSRKHIDLVSFNYMKVSLAAQVMSESVAIGLEEFYGQDVEETVKFIRHVNNFFDCLNVRSLTEGRNKKNDNLKPYRSVDDERLNYLEGEFLDYFDSWETSVQNRNGNFTKLQKSTMQISRQTVTGIKISVQSICSCVRYMLSQGAEYVLTHAFNQDPLEQHFGHYRHKGGANSNPTVYDIQNSITTLRTVQAHALPSKSGNCAGGMHNDVHCIDNSPVPRREKLR